MPERPPRYQPPIARQARQPKQRGHSSGDQQRGHSRARGYDRTWERLRKMHLNAHPFCAKCLPAVSRLATIVDHVVPIAVDPSRRLDPSNLQSLCKPHHDRDKQREDKRAAKARRAAMRAEVAGPEDDDALNKI